LDYVLDHILPKVTHPARYTGGEWNAALKNWDAAAVRLALIYPDTYEIGMSNLGLAILYDLVNAEPEMLAERAYAPWTDMEAAMRAAGIPLYSLESHRPLREFDILGFSLQYELTYTNILNMLDLSGIAIRADQRREEDPLILGGGSGAYNPEPLADFFDLFVVGEGEEALLELLHAYRQAKQAGAHKTDFLRQAARLPGVYVPSLYHVRYYLDGRVAEIVPLVPEAPAQIVKRMVNPLPTPPQRPLVPYIQPIHDRAVIEIQRGCTEGCRFCQAGMIYRPIRERPVEEILESADKILAATGFSELSLISLSSTDYTHIEELVGKLVARYGVEQLSLSLPSLRIDAFSVTLAEMIHSGRKTGLTFAPEAGSQRLRDVINKNVTEADLLRTAETAFQRNWRHLKLYFMIGLPTESDEDVDAIADLAHKVQQVGRQARQGRAEVNISVATFVPKPHTPFQWLPLADIALVESRQARLRARLRSNTFKLSWHGTRSTLLEAVICRGDRRLGRVIERVWRAGARFEAWDEYFNYALWEDAFQAEGLDPLFFSSRTREADEIFPWAHISTGVDREYLWAEYQRALSGETTPDCRGGCVECGARLSFALAACPPQ
jgi:radical SAM family uncharacterized protein